MEKLSVAHYAKIKPLAMVGSPLVLFEGVYIFDNAETLGALQIGGSVVCMGCLVIPKVIRAVKTHAAHAAQMRVCARHVNERSCERLGRRGG